MNAKNKNKTYWIIAAGLVMSVALFSITNGSMWGDELCRIADAVKGNFVDMWKTAMGYGQPGYMLFMFLWVQMVGNTEFLMRTSNLIFVGIAFYYIYRILQCKKYHPFFSLLFFIHPMFVYYMDEVTPYIMVYALSIAFVYYTFFAEEFGSIINIIKINLVFLLGVFIHFLFGFIYVLYLSKVFIQRPVKLKKHILVFSGFCIFYIPLLIMDSYGLFYIGPGTKTGFGIKNILYIIYAFLGFAGFGISRNDLRSGKFDAIGVNQIICMGILIIAVLAIVITWLRDRKEVRIDRREIVLGGAIYFAVWFLFALPIRFGLWERHCIGALPVYILAVMDLLHYMIERGKSRRFLALLYVACLIFSAVNIRCDYYYACDDYKGVSEYLQEELKQNEDITILYGTNVFAEGEYYAITEGQTKDLQKIIYVGSMDEETVNRALAENAESDKIIVVLFEKSVSSQLWHMYDGKSDLNVCDAYNSFRIVEY